MGGFLSGIGELLGGFSAKKQIDEEGFDWREKRRAANFERNRMEELAGQADEDRAVNIGRDILLGQEEGAPEPDLTSLIPGQTNRALTMGRIRGAVAQSKPALQSQNLYNQYQRDLLKGQQRKEEITLRGDEAEALAKMKNGLPPSPTDQAKIDAAMKRTGMTIDAMLQAVNIRESGADRRGTGGAAGEKPLYRTPATINPETGEAGTFMVYRDGRREFFPSAPTATMRDTAGMALTIGDSLQDMKDAAEKGVVNGPIAGRLSQWWQAAYPSGNEFLFDSAARRLVDIVYTKSGKQINQQEMKILEGLIPTRAKGNVEEQIVNFERYAEGLLRRYQGMQPGGARSTAPTSGAPSSRRRFNPATGDFE